MLVSLLLLWSLYCATLSLGRPAKKASVTRLQMVGIWRCLPPPPVSNAAEQNVVLEMERHFRGWKWATGGKATRQLSLEQVIEKANCEVARARRKNSDRREVGNLKTGRWRRWLQLLADTMLSTWCTKEGVTDLQCRERVQSLTGTDPKILAPGTMERLYESACRNVVTSENELRSSDTDFHQQLAKNRLEIYQCARDALWKLQKDIPAPEPAVFGPPSMATKEDLLGYGWEKEEEDEIDTDPNCKATVESSDRRCVFQQVWQSFLRHTAPGGPGAAGVGRFRALKLVPH